MSVSKVMVGIQGAALSAALMLYPLAAVQAQSAPAAAPTTCAGNGFLPGPGSYKSVEVLPDRRVTFRLCAPNAAFVAVTSSDIADAIPMGAGGLPMTRGAQGLWSVTTPVPVSPDTYRYSFSVDGVAVPNP